MASKLSTATYIINKLEKQAESWMQQEKWLITYKGCSVGLRAGFSSDTHWDDLPKVLGGEKAVAQEFYIKAKLLFKNEFRILPYKEKSKK